MNTGSVINIPARPYEDLESLKKYIRSERNEKYDMTNFREIITHINQLTTGTEAEIEAGDGIAIAQIGRGEVTVVLSGDADNASTNGKIYTLVYVDQDGTSHTATATGTATLNSVPVAFTAAASDFYAPVSFSASAADANVNVYAMIAGSTVHATISTTATSATQAQLIGVGAVYIRAHTNHNDSDGAVVYMEYLSGIGTIKYAHGTINTTDGTTEVRLFEATNDGDGTTTATSTTVKDFYRVRWLHTNTTPTVNCHEYLLTDSDCGNVDGSSNDIWAVIMEGNYESINTRYTPPTGYDAWVAKAELFALEGLAIGDGYYFNEYITRDGEAQGQLLSHIFSDLYGDENPILLEEMVDAYFQIYDTANATTMHIEITIIEVKRKQ